MGHRILRPLFESAKEFTKEHTIGAIKTKWEHYQDQQKFSRMTFAERQQFLEKRSSEHLESTRENFKDQQHQRKLNEEEEQLMEMRMKQFRKIIAVMEREDPEKAELFMEKIQEFMESAQQYRQQNQHIKGIDNHIERVTRNHVQELFEKLYPDSDLNLRRTNIAMRVFVEQMQLNVHLDN